MHLIHKDDFNSLLQKQPPRSDNKIFVKQFSQNNGKAPMTEYFFSKHCARIEVFITEFFRKCHHATVSCEFGHIYGRKNLFENRKFFLLCSETLDLTLI